MYGIVGADEMTRTAKSIYINLRSRDCFCLYV